MDQLLLCSSSIPLLIIRDFTVDASACHQYDVNNTGEKRGKILVNFVERKFFASVNVSQDRRGGGGGRDWYWKKAHDTVSLGRQ